MAEKKPNINIVFVGHVDHGKSTTIGRLMYDTGLLPEQELQKLKEEAQKHGKVGFEFAFVMDKFKEERERGLTIDLSYRKLVTKKWQVTIIDAPGHKDFVKNMITGASQADCAFLTVSAKEGVQPQTKEHLWLLRTMGVQQIAVNVNKMDTVDYKEEAYNKTKSDVSVILKQVGIAPEKVPFLAISALRGDNIAKKSDKMPWYKGPTILEQFDLFEAPKKPTQLPLRMPVQDVYTITGIGTVPVGRIETGILKVNDKIIVMPSGKIGEVKSIEMHHEQMPQAEPGDNVGINVRGLGKEDMRRGDVIGLPSNPPTVVKEFTARIVVLNHPTVMTVGYTPVFHVHTAQVSCKIKEIKRKIDPRTGQTVQDKPDFLKNGDTAEIVVEPLQPLCIEKQVDNPKLAKFAIRDMGRTVAAGMCIDSVKK